MPFRKHKWGQLAFKLKICVQRWQAKVGEYLACMEQDEWSDLAGEQSPRNGDMKDKTLEGIVVEL